VAGAAPRHNAGGPALARSGNGPLGDHGGDSGPGPSLRAASELHLAETWYRQTALEDLFGVPATLVNDDRCYRALDQLLPHKTALEQHLVTRLGELFTLDYDLLLYDVTSTYFEGQAETNPLARRGYSRDHRPTARRSASPLS